MHWQADGLTLLTDADELTRIAAVPSVLVRVASARALPCPLVTSCDALNTLYITTDLT